MRATLLWEKNPEKTDIRSRSKLPHNFLLLTKTPKGDYHNSTKLPHLRWGIFSSKCKIFCAITI